MLRRLRNRLILSHVLPLMIIIPLMGLAILYVVETQFLVPSVTRDLVGDSQLLVELTQVQANIWSEPQTAQAFLNQIRPNPGKRVMLLAPDGRLLASSDPLDKDRLNQIIQVGGLDLAQSGKLETRFNYDQRIKDNVIDVLAPVISPDHEFLGIIRVSAHYISVGDELLRLRYVIAGILIVGMAVGSVLGSILALNINVPVQQVTQAIFDLARGDRKESLKESGPDELRLLVQSVNHLLNRLQQLEQARRQLLANLVHELGRPLGALRMAIHALSTGANQNPELMGELMKGMDEETARLQRLLDDLAHLHEQVLGTLEIDRKQVSVSTWLPTMLLPWKEAASEKRLKWQETIPPDLPEISADPLRLEQIIGNLTSNAVKYTPVGGSISISAGTTQTEIWVRVRDTGSGIPPEEQEKIFKPFYRGQQGRRVVQGMGLGLTIARDLVIAHEGRLEVDSTPGLGSQFTVWLPLTNKN